MPRARARRALARLGSGRAPRTMYTAPPASSHHTGAMLSLKRSTRAGAIATADHPSPK